MSLLDYASLYDRFGGDNPTSYPLDPSAKRRLFKQGLLEFAAAMSKPNGGNFANSLATGLLSAKQAGQQGADQYVNDAYRGDIMQRTRDEMAAKTRLEQAKASVVGPDGQIDETRFRQYATLDPTGAKALRDALQPQVKRDFHAFDTGNGTVPIFTDDAGNMYDVNGQKVNFGGQPQAAPAQSMPPSVLHAAVEQQESGGNPFAVSPAGAMGPMQTMPMTLRDPGYGVAPAKDGSVDEQRRVGQQYLDALTAKYGLDGGLAAYNWGPGNWEKALAANGGNAQAALMSAPKETRDYVPGVRRRLGTLGGMTAGIGDTPSPQATGFASLPGFVPKKDTGKASTVTQRSQDLADMQAQGITVTKTMRDQYLMTGKMPGEDGGATPDDPLQGLDPATASLVKKISNYEALPSSLGRAGNRADLIGRAAMLNPEYDEAGAKSAYTFRQDMGKSSASSVGGQVTAANTALHHIATLMKANSALNKAGMDSQFPMVNKFKAGVSHQTGQAAVNNWNQAVHFVSEEMARLVKGGVASEGEVHDMVSKLDPSLSPQQRNAAIAQIVEFLHGRLAAVEEHRDQVLGDVGASIPILSKESQRIYDATQRLKGMGDSPAATIRYDAQGNRIQ